MADPRDTARQWLAERHAEAFNKCWHPYGDPCSACLVEAILTAPGVGVGTERYRDPGDPAEMHTGVVIRLPAEEGT